jgi:hypothetical protein
VVSEKDWDGGGATTISDLSGAIRSVRLRPRTV